MTATHGLEYGVFLAFAVVIVVLIVVVSARRGKNVYGRLWAPLIPLVGGTAQGSRLSGRHHGMPLTARIAGDADENPAFHYELTLTPGLTTGDWALSYTGEKFLGTGAKAWRVKSKDDALRQRLTEVGAVAAVQDWPDHPDITYKSKSDTLHYWQRVAGAHDVPTPEAFGAQLDLLSRLAEIGRRTATD